MNILYICDEYPPGKSGGIGTITRALATRMVKEGHHVFVAGLYMHGYGEEDHEVDQGVMVWRIRLPFDEFFKNNYSARETILLKFLTVSGMLQKHVQSAAVQFHASIQKLINDYSIDIVEWPDFCWYSKYLPVDYQWSALNVPLVVKFHGCHSYLDKQMNLPVNHRIYEVEKNHLARADAYVSVSKHTATEYRDLFNIGGDIKVLYNSIEIPTFEKQKRDEQTIVFTGSYVKLKGIENLFKAWDDVIERYPAAELHLYGKGKISRFLYALSTPARVSVYDEGFQPAHVIEQALRKATAAVFPSFTECFALAPMEAMANGCPVIYTNSASGPELVTNMQEGLLIDPSDPKSISDAICLIISDRLLADKLAGNALLRIKNEFSTTKSVSDQLAYYRQIIAGSNRVIKLKTTGQEATFSRQERII
jgi:glycosyltransferase involved in cell wall biosynthesis